MFNPKNQLPQPEFIALIAVLTSMVALSIDAMLPALNEIGQDLAVPNPNHPQYVITAFFLGFAVGQLYFGPLSDSLGRRKTVVLGMAVFGVGCILSWVSQDFTTMLIGRILQGIGASAPRVICMAIVRDLYVDRQMARVQSFVMSVFILVPALAPSLGQVVIELSDWRGIFLCLLLLGTITVLWMMTRLPESLPIEKRRPFSAKSIYGAAKETVTTRESFGYTIATGLIFSPFIVYLSTAPQVFVEAFDVPERHFPAYFAALALTIGASSVVNARLVVRLGMRRLTFAATFVLTLISLPLGIVLWIFSLNIPLILFMVWGMSSFFCIGLLFANLNALAISPMGHIAGTAAAVIGFLSTGISLLLGIPIGQLFDGSATPMIVAFGFFSLACGLAVIVTNKGFDAGPIGKGP